MIGPNSVVIFVSGILGYTINPKIKSTYRFWASHLAKEYIFLKWMVNCFIPILATKTLLFAAFFFYMQTKPNWMSTSRGLGKSRFLEMSWSGCLWSGLQTFWAGPEIIILHLAILRDWIVSLSKQGDGIAMVPSRFICPYPLRFYWGNSVSLIVLSAEFNQS